MKIPDTNSVVHICKIKGIGGCEKQLLALLPALRAKGWDIRLIILEERGWSVASILRRFKESGVEVEVLEMGGHGDPAMFARLVRRLRALEPGLVHTHLIHADVLGAFAARLARVRWLLSTRHGT